jgi:hypothetical protein
LYCCLEITGCILGIGSAHPGADNCTRCRSDAGAAAAADCTTNGCSEPRKIVLRTAYAFASSRNGAIRGQVAVVSTSPGLKIVVAPGLSQIEGGSDPRHRGIYGR